MSDQSRRMPHLGARIDALFARWNSSESPGAVVSVTQNGSEIHRGFYGMADLANSVELDERSVIRIGSQTKQFTVLLALMLEADGKLSMEHDVRSYLPWLPQYPQAITLRHLAANVGGVRDFLEIMTLGGRSLAAPSSRDEVREFISSHKGVNFPPGDDLVYSNTGFFLLSEIVEQVSGCSFNELLQRKITGPLGMTQTRLMPLDSDILPRLADHHSRGADGRWHRPHWGMALGGEGGIVSTLDDMKTWLANLDSPRAETAGMIAQMSKPGAIINGTKSAYGLGLVLSKYRGLSGVGHGGGVAGGLSQSVRFPEIGIGIAILGNNDDMYPHSLARRIVDFVLDGKTGPFKTPEASARLKKAVGLYRVESGDDAFAIVVKNDEPLFLGSDGVMPIEQIGDNVFTPERAIFPLEFSPREDGSIDASWFGHRRLYQRLSDVPLKCPENLPGRYAATSAGLNAEIGIENGEIVLRLQSGFGSWACILEARGRDFCLARPRGAASNEAREEPWLFTIRRTDEGIVLNNDRTKRLHFTRAAAS